MFAVFVFLITHYRHRSRMCTEGKGEKTGFDLPLCICAFHFTSSKQKQQQQQQQTPPIIFNIIIITIVEWMSSLALPFPPFFFCYYSSSLPSLVTVLFHRVL
ncbi:hypothetical protein, unlikely [Trypanosoma brucei gambiense DAL972]|uniref:Uncharacterized protein n=1 Tax=Trypanosoma brucei gambiense (strain MHOM/CI/86/DAL972) TaxID=679716 RepID=D0A031_TRYB9|nr:hypothetical protein, unlikely [Trypanosoma brucei gambiense DAL972]CBH16589.1 hypothetical protein, unlikely [Trypanosoma brucei gambiense DAL972]|eukprot:XP_011778853.1 hypothetical protein, unlikely [Trypanosoma brucei gambiense DAL972]